MAIKVLGFGLEDALGLGEGFVVLAERAVHVNQADGRGGGSAHALGGLVEQVDGLLGATCGGGGVTEMAEGHLIGRIQLDGTGEGLAGLLGAALGCERLPQVVPGVGMVGGQLGGALQLLGGTVGVELHAGATGQHEQLDIVGSGTETRERGLAARAIVPRLQVSLRLLRGLCTHRALPFIRDVDPGQTQLLSSGGSSPTSRA